MVWRLLHPRSKTGSEDWLVEPQAFPKPFDDDLLQRSGEKKNMFMKVPSNRTHEATKELPIPVYPV